MKIKHLITTAITTKELVDRLPHVWPPKGWIDKTWRPSEIELVK